MVREIDGCNIKLKTKLNKAEEQYKCGGTLVEVFYGHIGESKRHDRFVGWARSCDCLFQPNSNLVFDDCR
jgi:hypothetical protein